VQMLPLLIFLGYCVLKLERGAVHVLGERTWQI
jgi:hypothetical protein